MLMEDNTVIFWVKQKIKFLKKCLPAANGNISEETDRIKQKLSAAICRNSMKFFRAKVDPTIMTPARLPLTFVPDSGFFRIFFLSCKANARV